MGVHLGTQMRYYIFHHQHKGYGINSALRQQGWILSSHNVAIALFDHAINKDRPEEGRKILNKYHDEKSTILTYPHGATGAWWTDNDMFPPNKNVFANLVIGEGHKFVDTIIQPQIEHHVIGWTYCPINEFKKPKEVRNILFAPIHASMKSGKLREECIDTNARVYKSLLELAGQYKISVRTLNPLEQIGLWKSPKVSFKPGKPDGTYDDIDSADLVIAEGTYMYLSVARGKPTIGMNQHIPIRPNDSDKSFKLNHWNEYGDYMAYPIDFDNDTNLQNLITIASTNEQTEWKKLFIGKELDAKHLSNLLKEIRAKDISIRN